jgi:exodeoxyribonuclease VII small subunit
MNLTDPMNRRPPVETELQSSPAQAPDSLEGRASGTGPSFEAAIKRLTEIVQTLERGELPLEESLRLFEEGVKLSRVSQQRLDAAEKRVEQLLAVDEQGRARTAPFATDSAERDDDSGPPF